MTGCLYVSLPIYPDRPDTGVIPVLIADTLVSFKADFLENAPLVTPMNVTRATGKGISRVALTRKLHIVEGEFGNTAAAFAGDGHLIRECLGTLKHRMIEWELGGRPMRKFGDNVNLYKARGALEAIGVWVPIGGRLINSMARGPFFHLANLGRCASIGSGDGDLERLARTMDEKIDPSLHVRDRIETFASSMRGIRLARELMNDANSTWGGFIEYIYNNPDTRRWERGPKEIYLFYFLTIDERGSATASISNRLIAYDPGIHGGSIRSCWNELGNEVLCEFRLGEDIEAEDLVELWVGWLPEVIIITFIVKTIDVENKYYSVKLSKSNTARVEFVSNADNFGFKMEESLIKELIDMLIAQLNGRYASDPTAVG